MVEIERLGFSRQFIYKSQVGEIGRLGFLGSIYTSKVGRDMQPPISRQYLCLTGWLK